MAAPGSDEWPAAASAGEVKVEEKAGVVPWREAWSRAGEKLPRLTLTVDNPVQAGSALSRHVTYRVRSRCSRDDGSEDEFEITRRFSEFATLREALVQRYVGLLVPPIPPKELTSIASMSAKAADKQTKQRLRVLSLFAERLGTIPWLGDDAVLRSFVGASKEPFAKALEAEQAPGAIATDEAQVSGRGRALWYATIQRSDAAPAVATRRPATRFHERVRSKKRVVTDASRRSRRSRGSSRT